MENNRTGKHKVSDFLTKNAPPGFDTDKEVRMYITGLVLMLVFSLNFFWDYYDAYDALFHWVKEEKVLLTGVVMQNFSEILGDNLRGFYLYCIVIAVMVLQHYWYYYQGSKSIYVMKRLKNPMEIHRRAWVIPLLGIVVTLLIAFVVMMLYFEFYMIVTPKQCIAPGQWQNIWR